MRLARRFAGPLSVLVIAALIVGMAHASGLRLNLTPSVPRGVYLLRPGAPAKGDLVAACLPAEAAALGRRRGYLRAGNCAGASAPVLKLVAATAGDVIEIGTDVRVNGAQLQPAPPLTDQTGRRLEPYAPGRYELGAGELWLYSPSPYSWDSRFFGPIPETRTLGLAKAVWTWGASRN